MIKLKRRQNFDNLKPDPRIVKKSWGKYVYLAFIAIFVIWIFDSIFGDLFFFRAKGLVLREKTEISTEFTSTVKELLVKQGSKVDKNQHIIKLSSHNVIKELADLKGDYVTFRNKLADLKIRLEVAKSVLNTAEKRYSSAQKTSNNMQKMFKKGLVTENNKRSAIVEEFTSQTERSQKIAEIKTISKEIETLEKIIQEYNNTVLSLEKIYNDGFIDSPTKGIVGKISVSVGSVIKSGEPILSIYSKPDYVLAYLPTGAFYDVKKGKKVLISTGVKNYKGTIEEVESVAASLPKEFQKTFRPSDTAQIMRVSFDKKQNHPPLFTKVSISSKTNPISIIKSFFKTRI